MLRLHQASVSPGYVVVKQHGTVSNILRHLISIFLHPVEPTLLCHRAIGCSSNMSKADGYGATRKVAPAFGADRSPRLLFFLGKPRFCRIPVLNLFTCYDTSSPHSYRKAIAGSTLLAARAGTRHASNAPVTMTRADPSKVAGSVGRTPYSKLAIN